MTRLDVESIGRLLEVRSTIACAPHRQPSACVHSKARSSYPRGSRAPGRPSSLRRTAGRKDHCADEGCGAGDTSCACTSNRDERTAVMSRQGLLASVSSQVCAAHRLPSASELDLDSSGHEPPVLMKLSHHLLWLSHHIGDDVPQPEHKSQSGARSVE